MADQVRDFDGYPRRLKDMGDGTWADVVYLGTASGGGGGGSSDVNINEVGGTAVTDSIPVSEVGTTLKAAAIQDVTTAGTRVQLSSVPCRQITIIAKKDNTGSIYAGMNTVSSSVYGVELEAKDSFTFEVSNANQVWLDSSVNGEGASYVAV